jgi:prepilin-type N-terminal cleavage/methylation domain-containing protein
VIRDAARRSGRLARPSAARPGFSLLEVLVSLVMMSVLLTLGVPQFTLSLEQAKANVAGANLRSIWSAQRLYWLQNPNRQYAPDLPTLQSENLIDPSLAAATAPYAYSVAASPDGSSFTATATRSGTTSWTGEFTIAADGSFSGSVQQPGQSTLIVPSFQ